MGEVTAYPNGTFCWIDLGTTDLEGSKAFYGGLLGWDTEDLPAPEGSTYTMCRLHGKDVAGMHGHPAEEGTGWTSYVSADDVDAATSRARELGAEILLEPADIPGTARISLFRDPTGAEVGLWQPADFIGAGLVNDVGAWSWNELATTDVPAAKAFYGALFGWTAEDVSPEIQRGSFRIGRRLIGGLHAPSPAERDASQWTVSFTVDDADASAEAAQGLGGRVLLPPMDIPVGRFTLVADPGGTPITLAAVPGGPLGGIDGSPPLP